MKLKLEIEPGEDIQDACVEAQRVATAVAWPVEFEFNSVICVAEPGGSATRLHSSWLEVKDQRPRATSL